MKYQFIQEQNRAPFFALISKMLDGTVTVEVEVAALEFGDQIEEDWVAFRGLSFDSDDDILYVHTELVDHEIPSPHDVTVGDENGAIRSISMKDAEDHLQILNFKELLRLAAPIY